MAPCSETRAGERRGRPRLPGRRAEKPRVRGLRAASWGGAADTPSLLPFSPVRVPPQAPAPGTQPVRSPDTCCSFVKLHVPTKLARVPGRESPSDLLRARPPGGKGLAGRGALWTALDSFLYLHTRSSDQLWWKKNPRLVTQGRAASATPGRHVQTTDSAFCTPDIPSTEPRVPSPTPGGPERVRLREQDGLPITPLCLVPH